MSQLLKKKIKFLFDFLKTVQEKHTKISKLLLKKNLNQEIESVKNDSVRQKNNQIAKK